MAKIGRKQTPVDDGGVIMPINQSTLADLQTSRHLPTAANVKNCERTWRYRPGA